MKLSTERHILIGLRGVIALALFGTAVRLLTILNDNAGSTWLVIGLIVAVGITLCGVHWLVMMIDEAGNLFADKVNDQIVTLEEEKSLFGREEFEEQIEDEEEDSEIELIAAEVIEEFQ